TVRVACVWFREKGFRPRGGGTLLDRPSRSPCQGFLGVGVVGLALELGAGAGVSGTAGFAFVGAGAVGAAGCCENGSSSTERGVDACALMSCSRYASPMKMPADHHVVFVSRLAACRVPMNESGDEPAPPNAADNPPPFGDCKRT